MSARALGAAAIVMAGLLTAACHAPDPKKELEIEDLETYWAVDAPVGSTQYIAPMARFRLRNKGQQTFHFVQATASFRRKGQESVTWGSAWVNVVPRGQSLGPGQSTIVELKSDARYYSTGPPESMFHHPRFRDATVEVFVRVGSSGWVSFAKTEVARQIGSKSLSTAP